MSIDVTVVGMRRPNATKLRTWPANLTILGVIVVSVVVLLAVASNMRSSAEGGFTTADMKLVHVDDFEGPAGTAPDARFWDYDIGGNGWGNREQQTYTRDPDNVRLSGTGDLVIEARQAGDSYTSARLVSRGKLAFGYGLVEVRAKLPEGQGIHPAIWMLGENLRAVGWPQCGEIDIMELVNSGTTYNNAIHGPTDADQKVGWQQSSKGPASSNLASDYHVYQLYREPGLIKIGIDGVLVGQHTRASIPPGANWVFDDAPIYLTLNIAVGGEWPGPVGRNTPLPATMLVDSVRFWQ
jgi:beta-glucanase (GH16 family)